MEQGMEKMIVGKVEGQMVTEGIIDKETIGENSLGKSAEEQLASIGIAEAGELKQAQQVATNVVLDNIVEGDEQLVVDMLVKKHGMTEEKAKEYLDTRKKEQANQIEIAKCQFIEKMMEQTKCSKEEAETRFKQVYAESYMDPVDSYVYKQFIGVTDFFRRVNEAMSVLGYDRQRRHTELLSIAKDYKFESEELSIEFQKQARLFLEDAWAGMGAIKEYLKQKEAEKEVVPQVEAELVGVEK